MGANSGVGKGYNTVSMHIHDVSDLIQPLRGGKIPVSKDKF